MNMVLYKKSIVVDKVLAHLRCKLFTFSSSSQEPLSQFQPNLAQCILGKWGFKFVKNEGLRPFPRGDNKEITKIQ